MVLQKCLIIDPVHESLFPMLHAIGWEVVYYPTISRQEIKETHQVFAGLIVRSKTTIDRDLLGDNPTLKFVGRAGAGLDNLDLDYLRNKKINVLHAGEGNRDAVGEHAIGILLALMRNIVVADGQVRALTWKREENRGSEIMGKTIGIIGYGNMGQSFASRLSGFGCKVLAFDKYKTNFSDSYVEEVDMQRLYNEADILSLHVPLNTDTLKMVNKKYVKRFKNNILLINTSRGEIILQNDLIQLLDSGKIKGAALDVLENEKLNTLTTSEHENMNKLVQYPNVIFTPHIAGWTFESHVKINVALVEKIKLLKIT